MSDPCRICGRGFRFLPPHLRHAHQISTADYRRQYGIQASERLADDSYREMSAERMRLMLADGRVTLDHLPKAVEAACAVTRLPPGAKRADGRNADHAREYQRAYKIKRKNRVGEGK
ncbi:MULTISPECIES: MucR family transcriptional regulator [Methylobacterium]|uniref:MucR family transcriptional regulator n=1 Tax=Methylobacterium TaxID=407 RepID=UPI0011AE2DD0